MQHKDCSKTALSVIHKSSELVAQLGDHLSQVQKECLATVLALDDDAQALALHPEKPENSKQEENFARDTLAIAVVSPCELVSQWAERTKMLLLLPIYQKSETDQQHLMDLFCAEMLGINQHEMLGLLTLSHKRPDILKGRVGFPNFVEGWKFVLTVSFPMEEEAIWIMPLNREALERRGGEVDLPQALAKVWNCAAD